jgi:hypothetical protein
MVMCSVRNGWYEQMHINTSNERFSEPRDDRRNIHSVKQALVRRIQDSAFGDAPDQTCKSFWAIISFIPSHAHFYTL